MVTRVKKALSRQLSKRVHAEDRACFRNSAMALISADDDSLRYVEGYALGDFWPMQHGWLEGRDGRGAFVIDVTPVWLEKSGKVKYFAGTRYTRGEVCKHIGRKGQLPIVDLFEVAPAMRPAFKAATQAMIGKDKWPAYAKMMGMAE